MNELFPYQREGALWLKDRKLALLADEMGLGKSAQAITAADLNGSKRICVLCPAVARTNWHREFKKFSSMQRPFNLVFSKSAPSNHSDSVICSYDLASGFDPNHFGRFDLLILDEAHYLKTVKTKRTQVVYGKTGYVRNSKRVWALTGTPAPNHAGELWPFLYTCGLTPKSYDGFLEHYCTYLESAYGRQITGTRTDRIPELRDILSKVMLRRKADQVLKDLPQMFFQPMVIDSEDSPIDFEFKTDPKFQKERELLEQTFGHLDMSSVDAMNILEGLAGSVSSLRRYVGLKKVGGIAETVASELAYGAYNKIVLFAIHTQVIDHLKHRLTDFGSVVVNGETPYAKRQQNIDAFQNDPKCRVFIGNIHAAGTAITLTSANQGILVEQDWVPGNNAQAVKRLHRIGQLKPVFIRVASLANSFDERVGHILTRKAGELAQIFDERKSLPNFFSETNT